MEAALHFCGVKTACPVPSGSAGRSLSSQVVLSQRLRFKACVASTGGLCATGRKFSCTSRGLRVGCDAGAVDVLERNEVEDSSVGENEKQLSCVMKFGGSSVASAERMREVAELILSFPEERPVIVLSAMGKTTNKLLLVSLLLSLSLPLCSLFLFVCSMNLKRMVSNVLGWREGRWLWRY